MEKTTVYLSAEQKAALARAAAAEGRSEAVLIRAGIDVVTVRHRAGEAAAAYPAAAPAVEAGSNPSAPPRWVARDVFVREILRHPADAGLRDDLAVFSGGTTDDEPIP